LEEVIRHKRWTYYGVIYKNINELQKLARAKIVSKSLEARNLEKK